MPPKPDIVGRFQDGASEAKDKAKDKAEETKETVKDKVVGKFQGDSGSENNDNGDNTDSSGSTNTSTGSNSSTGSSSDINSPENVRDRIIQDPDTKDPRNLDKQETSQELEQQRDNPVLNAANPGREKFLEARKQNLEARETLQQQENKVRNAGENQEFQVGGQTLSRSEALQNIQQQKRQVDQNLEQNNQALVNINRNRKNPVQITERASKQARNVDLDQEGNPNNIGTEISRPRTGTINDRNTPPALNGPGETFQERSRTGQFADILLSNRGGELIAASVPGGRTPRDVREDVARNRQVSGNPGFSRLGSPVGLAAGGVAGGLAFKGGTRLLSSVSNTAGQVATRGGQFLAGAETGKVTARASNDIQSGQTTRGFERLVNFGAASGGFLQGGRSFSKRLGRRVGTTKVNSKSISNPETDQGVGQFLATTNIVKPKIRGSPETEIQTTTGRFARTGSTTKGSFDSRSPTGSERLGEFETVNVPQGSGTTKQGNRFRDSTNVVRTSEDGTLFVGRRDNSQVLRNVETNRRTASQEEVARSVENVPVRNDLEAVEIESTGQNTVGSSTVFIRRAQGSNGGSNTRSQGRTQEGSTGSQKTVTEAEDSTGIAEDLDIDRIAQDRKAFQDIAEDQAQRTISNNPSSTSSSTTISTGSQETENKQGTVQEQDSNVETFESSTTESINLSQEQVNDQDTTVIQDQNTDTDTSVTTVQASTQDSSQETSTVQQIKGLQNTSTGQIQVGRNQVGQDSFNGLTLGLGSVQSQGIGLTGLNGLSNLSTRRGSLSTGIPGNARAGSLGFSLPTQENFQSSSNTPRQNASTGSSGTTTAPLDWISANAVEQQGGTPVFNLAKVEESSFFQGITTVQENQGKTRENQRDYF